MEPHRLFALACYYGWRIPILVALLHVALHVLGVPHVETLALIP